MRLTFTPQALADLTQMRATRKDALTVYTDALARGVRPVKLDRGWRLDTRSMRLLLNPTGATVTAIYPTTPPLDPERVQLSARTLMVARALTNLSPENSAAWLREKLAPLAGQTGRILGRSKANDRPLRHYTSGPFTFVLTLDNLSLLRLEVDDELALAAGYGSVLVPDAVFIPPGVSRYFAIHRGTSLNSAEAELRAHLLAAAEQDLPEVEEGTRAYAVGGLILDLAPALYLLASVEFLTKENAPWAEDRPVPLDPSVLGVLPSALTRFAALKGLPHATPEERSAALTEFRVAMERFRGELSEVKVSSYSETRHYVADDFRAIVGSGNRVVVTVESSYGRASTLAVDSLVALSQARRDLARLAGIERDDALALFQRLLAPFDGSPPESIRDTRDARGAWTFTVDLDGTSVEVCIDPDGTRILRAFALSPV